MISQVLLIYFLIYMNTFIFCTSYFDNKADYEHRYSKWAAYYTNIELSKDKPVLMIDDGSDNSLINDENFAVIKAEELSEDTKLNKEKINLIKKKILNHPKLKHAAVLSKIMTTLKPGN